ncbi:MAG TPA: polyprenyl diphosphate synthase [Acetobacteraceae bacterium]|nr:polyprenyl diphosphate synthase [Acetobacteraceae bacterium]
MLGVDSHAGAAPPIGVGVGLRRRMLRVLWPLLRTAAWPVYAVYEQRLVRQVALRPPPRHIGLVLDGNRRYAMREGLAHAREAYRLGAQKLDQVIEWCLELSIPAVTLWVCSTDNLARPADQVAGLLAAVEEKMRALAKDPHIHSHRIRVRAIGRLEQLPAGTRAAIRAAEQATAGYDGMLLSIAVAYGGREEIADAVRGLLAEAAERGCSLPELAEAVTPEAIARHLYLAAAPEPDLIIRTSGEVRLSGFLLWHSATSEFYFSEVLWPAFRRIDFLRAIRAFQERNRRFGR